MRIRGLLIAAAVLAGLAAGVWWSNRAKKAEEGKPRPDEPPKILSLAEDQIRPDRDPARRASSPPSSGEEPGRQLGDHGAPEPLRIDRDAVSSMTSTLSSLNSDRLIEEKAQDLAPYGLNRRRLKWSSR
jgi:hypothetical protein